ncbi:hypothetical protein EON65_29130 [archaeon]|nr:MAG: hypothetical protein EON65_29130 [archaeon]
MSWICTSSILFDHVFSLCFFSLLLGVKKQKFVIHSSDPTHPSHPTLDHSHSTYQTLEKTHFGPNSLYSAYSVTGPAVYHLGIVDFLQNWTTQKKIERTFKTYLKRKDPDGLSVMHPTPYKLRFQNKMEQIFDVDFQSTNVVHLRPKVEGEDMRLGMGMESKRENREEDKKKNKRGGKKGKPDLANLDVHSTPLSVLPASTSNSNFLTPTPSSPITPTHITSPSGASSARSSVKLLDRSEKRTYELEEDDDIF